MRWPHCGIPTFMVIQQWFSHYNKFAVRHRPMFDILPHTGIQIAPKTNCLKLYSFQKFNENLSVFCQVCWSSLLGRNVRWPRCMLPPGEWRWVCRRDRRAPYRYIMRFAGGGQLSNCANEQTDKLDTMRKRCRNIIYFADVITATSHNISTINLSCVVNYFYTLKWTAKCWHSQKWRLFGNLINQLEVVTYNLRIKTRRKKLKTRNSISNCYTKYN